MASFLLRTLLILASIGRALSSEGPCVTLSVDTPSEFSMPRVNGNNCMTTPSGGLYRLTVLSDTLGRYGFLHRHTEDGLVDDNYWGMAWAAPNPGLVYCVAGDTSIAFTNYVPGSTISVSVEDVSNDDQDCESKVIGHDGVDVADVAPSPPGGAVFWSDDRYMLRADFFGYTLGGQETVTMAEGAQVEINGDPGGDDYMTIEIYWYIDGLEKRFYGYFESDGATWNMYEARVYDLDEEWVEFAPLFDVSGPRDTCFRKKTLSLEHYRPGFDVFTGIQQIVFANLTLATFLPWSGDNAVETCINVPNSDNEPNLFIQVSGDSSQQVLDSTIVTDAEDGMLVPNSMFEDNQVIWSSPRYYLQASYFGFTINDQETVTMAGSTTFDVDGDPGDGSYITIEISFLAADGVTGHQFNAYFESDGVGFNLFEARVTNPLTESWESFAGLSDAVASEDRRDCFTQEVLVLTNENGSEIRFENLTLAVFLPWDDVEDAGTTVAQSRSAGVGVPQDKQACLDLLSRRAIVPTSTNENAAATNDDPSEEQETNDNPSEEQATSAPQVDEGTSGAFTGGLFKSGIILVGGTILSSSWLFV